MRGSVYYQTAQLAKHIFVEGAKKYEKTDPCHEDETLITYLKESQIPLTVCPLSNVKLRAVPKMEAHNILRLLEKGLCVTVNSDDPAYFGGYLNKNFEALHKALQMDEKALRTLVKNSFCASFLPEEKKVYFYKQIEEMV